MRWKGFPLLEQYRLEFFSDIFRIFYKFHIRLWHNYENLDKYWHCCTKMKVFFKNGCNWLSFLVHPFVLGVEFWNEHFFSLFSELVTIAVYFFYYCDYHITLPVSLWVEVFSSHFIQVFVSDIPQVFRESLLECSVGLPHILLWAFVAAQEVD